MLIVGLDAASQFENFGFALGTLKDGRLSIGRAGVLGRNAAETLTEIAEAIRTASVGVVAIDAPLGWPEPMGRLLHAHRAGHPLEIAKNQFFRRTTDRVVRAATGKNPLEVGADKIARAAHHAIEVLARLRQISGKQIPLGWTVPPTEVVAIEVYPAATLTSRSCEVGGYKDKVKGMAVRARMAEVLSSEIPGLTNFAGNSDHEFDACLCLLAAKDYLNSAVVPPDDMRLAEIEGWIWVRSTRSPDEIRMALAKDVATDGFPAPRLTVDPL